MNGPYAPSPSATDRYLWPVVEPAEPVHLADYEHRLLGQIEDLGWKVEVGTGARVPSAAQLLSHKVSPDVAFRSFSVDAASDAQANFLRRMIEIASEAATLAHLLQTQPSHTDTPLERTFLSDPLTGAVAAQYADGTVRYSLRSHYPDVEIVSFDFSVREEPFAWTSEGWAVPFPAINNSGFSVGYSGSGPGAVTDGVLGFLGLTRDEVALRDDWPLWNRGYSDKYAASRLRDRLR